MLYTIPVKANLIDENELSRVLSNLKEIPEVSIKAIEKTGLSMDPATVALVFELAKVTVPALITALATIWVEHLKNKKQTEKSKPASNTSKPSIVIETDTGNIQIVLDSSNVQASVVNVGIPKTAEEITRIRLEE